MTYSSLPIVTYHDTRSIFDVTILQVSYDTSLFLKKKTSFLTRNSEAFSLYKKDAVTYYRKCFISSEWVRCYNLLCKITAYAGSSTHEPTNGGVLI